MRLVLIGINERLGQKVALRSMPMEESVLELIAKEEVDILQEKRMVFESVLRL